MTVPITRPRVGEDLLHGAPAIADYIGMTKSAVYALAKAPDNGFPAFMAAGKLHARRQALDHWLLALEREAAGRPVAERTPVNSKGGAMD